MDQHNNQQIKDIEEIQKLMTFIAREKEILKELARKFIIEKLKLKELPAEIIAGIVKIVNQFLKPHQIQVLHWKNTARKIDTYVCVQYEKTLVEKDNIFFYCPHEDVVDLPYRTDTIRSEIKGLFQQQPFHYIRGHCPKPQNCFYGRFVYAVAYGFCRATGLEFSAFTSGLGDDGNTQHIRNVIVNILIEGQLNRDELESRWRGEPLN